MTKNADAQCLKQHALNYRTKQHAKGQTTDCPQGTVEPTTETGYALRSERIPIKNAYAHATCF